MSSDKLDTNSALQSRHRMISIYRRLSRVFGAGATGTITCQLYRFGLLKSDQKSYFVLNTNPLIIYIGNVMRHAFEVAELFRHRPTHFIKNFYHTFENDERLRLLSKEVRLFKKRYPQHSITFICATPSEQAMFQEHGIEPAHFINKNAFVDENQYQIREGISKKFDAVYNGQLATYKRHELAADVKSLALIVYRHQSIGRTQENDHYGEEIRGLLGHATWLNDIDTFIPPKEISDYLCKARVGLALSAEEGPMAACMEYLLSGLPVVSTPSLGGRDVFFDERYTLVVKPEPESVACGVKELIARRIDPHFVRRETIKKMQAHRERFILVVNQILAEGGAPADFESRFPQIFVNKLRASGPFPGALLKQSVNGMPIELCRAFASTRNA